MEEADRLEKDVIIENVLNKHQELFLIGSSMMDCVTARLCVALNNGEKWQGHQCHAEHVLYINLCGRQSIVEGLVDEYSEKKGRYSFEHIKSISFDPCAPNFMNWMLLIIKQYSPDVVILDSSHANMLEADDYDEYYRGLRTEMPSDRVTWLKEMADRILDEGDCASVCITYENTEMPDELSHIASSNTTIFKFNQDEVDEYASYVRLGGNTYR